MHSDHFAIVIGLRSYPRLGDPPPSNLEGPENDAKLVAEWLADPAGGALPDANVRTIVSSGWKSPPDAAPTADQINEAFLWLDGLADASQKAGKGRRVGVRLYIYVSGHGCAPKPRQGCLLTGNAALNTITSNICPIEWIDWLQGANYFREFVLWQDCCTDRQFSPCRQQRRSNRCSAAIRRVPPSSPWLRPTACGPSRNPCRMMAINGMASSHGAWCRDCVARRRTRTAR